MNRSAMIIKLLLVCVLLPLSGIASQDGMTEEAQPPLPKDECLLYLVRCDSGVQSIQDKIQKLQEEIAKGTRAYSVEELRILENRLREVSRIIDMLMEK